jgi:cyclopropane-fatty-acyl-phospholipid synthase
MLRQKLAKITLIGLARAFVREEFQIVDANGPIRACRRNRSRRSSEDIMTSSITISDTRAWSLVLLGGSAGLGEAWFKGYWDTDDLTTALRVLARATRTADRPRSALHGITRPISDRLRRLRPQDKKRDRRNIGAHYDLGNDFFEHFLDPTMMYSSAIFPSPEATLEEASVEKLDRLCRLIGLAPGDRVLEIGTGWGGFAIHAATRFEAIVTTTTISAEQFAYARDRVNRAGLSDRIVVLHDDYRDLSGTWDKVVSIEMIEAVDWREYDTFFEHCCKLLKSGGTMGLQAILIEDDRFERAKNTQDFIKAHVFPGGCLPSNDAILRSVAKVTDFTMTAKVAFGPDYAETLRRWRTNLHSDEAALAALGLDRQFLRLWDFYLCYCEAGFDERSIDVAQIVLTRADT